MFEAFWHSRGTNKPNNPVMLFSQLLNQRTNSDLNLEIKRLTTWESADERWVMFLSPQWETHHTKPKGTLSALPELFTEHWTDGRQNIVLWWVSWFIATHVGDFTSQWSKTGEFRTLLSVCYSIYTSATTWDFIWYSLFLNLPFDPIQVFEKSEKVKKCEHEPFIHRQSRCMCHLFWTSYYSEMPSSAGE